MTSRRRLTLALALTLFASACAHIQLVADYDEATMNETIRVGRRVDVFYGTLVELEPAQRTYAPFAKDYIDIGADIRSLVRRNAARPLNDESLKISSDILGFWQAYQKKHKTANAYPDARLDQLRFDRLFTAAVSAEAAKQRAPGDTSPPADSNP